MSVPTTYFQMTFDAAATIRPIQKQMAEMGVKVMMSDVRFMKFIGEEIFPGGQLPAQKTSSNSAQAADFSVEKVIAAAAFHARTLNI